MNINNHQSLIARINENAVQNTNQTNRLEDKRLSEDIQDRLRNEKRVENKNEVDLKSPNDPREQIGRNLTTQSKSESAEIFERYTASGNRADSLPNLGTSISVKV